MTLTKQRQKEKKARDLIYEALKEFHNYEPSFPVFTKERISHEKYHKELTKQGLDEGIVAFALINNMSGVSAPGIDLYRLLHEYILNIEIREKINKLLEQDIKT
ncbi:MAG: hypothetical protein NUV74_08150 [Candidatus Brocadiaceae bacterium]|nr:hypothetical protein [Candidatus Brocadiaceae bacterium]